MYVSCIDADFCFMVSMNASTDLLVRRLVMVDLLDKQIAQTTVAGFVQWSVNAGCQIKTDCCVTMRRLSLSSLPFIVVVALTGLHVSNLLGFSSKRFLAESKTLLGLSANLSFERRATLKSWTINQIQDDDNENWIDPTRPQYSTARRRDPPRQRTIQAHYRTTNCASENPVWQ